MFDLPKAADGPDFHVDSSVVPLNLLQPPHPRRSVRMQPVTFAGCFGWLHPARQYGVETSVLLCPGLSHDLSTGHRSFRVLANRLADLGYPVLRFDYPGTGDSCETGASDRVAEWTSSVHAAVNWLRDNTGAQRVVMVGLRFGATLATLAASTRDDVAGLVLLDPVIRGKSFVGQLAVEARMRPGFVAAPDDRLDLDGLLLPGETVRLIRQLDLRQVRLSPASSMAIFAQVQTPVLSACVEAWRDAGAKVTNESFAGLEALLRPTHLADEPCGEFTPVVSWIETMCPSRRVGPHSVAPLPETISLHHSGCVETPIGFGEHRRLFGMLCRPAGNAQRDLAVVICNTGGYPHYGFGRFGVEFARRLATVGIASLRIDFSGVGDSLNPGDPSTDATHVFEIERTSDIRASVDVLEQFGYRRFAVNGLCSGAYHALHGIIADDRLGTLLGINLPLFTLRLERPGPSSFARTAMAALSRRGVRTLLMFAEGDAGLKPLERHFGPGGAELGELPGTTLAVVPNIDHNLTGSAMRRIAADRMIDFLSEASSVRSPSGASDEAAVADSRHSLVS